MAGAMIYADKKGKVHLRQGFKPHLPRTVGEVFKAPTGSGAWRFRTYDGVAGSGYRTKTEALKGLERVLP